MGGGGGMVEVRGLEKIQNFSKSHSVMCFSIGQLKQTFCIFCTCKRYACCLFWDSKKIKPTQT